MRGKVAAHVAIISLDDQKNKKFSILTFLDCFNATTHSTNLKIHVLFSMMMIKKDMKKRLTNTIFTAVCVVGR